MYYNTHNEGKWINKRDQIASDIHPFSPQKLTKFGEKLKIKGKSYTCINSV